MRKLVLGCVLVVSFLLAVNAGASEKLWEAKLTKKMSWNQLTFAGTLLVGSPTSITSFNPDTGKEMWNRDDLTRTAPFNVREVTGLPILIVSDYAGLAGSNTQLYGVNLVSGENIWQTEKMMGYPIGIYPIPEKKMFILFYSGYTEEDGTGIQMKAYNAETGAELWTNKFAKQNEIPLHLADNATGFYAKMDLSGHQEPVAIGDDFYVPFTGVSAIDLNTGNLKWEVKFKPAHKSLKKAYAPLYFEGDTIYATGGGVVYAINKNNGEIKWQTEKVRSGLIAQIIVAQDMVLARLGGNFFNPGAKQFTLDAPLGVVAYEKATGKELWQYKGAKNGITNLVLLPDASTVMFADGDYLTGIDAKSTGVVKEAFKQKLEFTRSIGGGEVAAAGVKALTGGIGGMLKAGAKMANRKDRMDIPVAVTKQNDGTLVVRGRQHLVGFDPNTKEVKWSLYFAAPGASNFEFITMTALTAFTTVAYQAGYASGSFGMENARQGIEKSWGDLDKVVARRYEASKSTEEHVYILTNVEEEGKKGIGLMTISLNGGETGRQIILNSKQPQYTVDEIEGRLFYFHGTDLSVYSLN